MTLREKKFLGVFAVVLVLGGSYIGYEFWKKQPKPIKSSAAVATPELTEEKNNDQVTPNSAASKITPIVDSGVSWIEPEKLSDLKLFKKGESFDCDIDNLEYYKVADLVAGGEIVLAKTACGMSPDSFFRFKKSTDGKYSLLKNLSTDFDYMGDPSTFLVDYGNTTLVDQKTSYASISSPDVIQTDNNVILRKSFSDVLFSELKNATKIAESSYGLVYKNTEIPADQNTDVLLRTIYLKHADGTATSYSYRADFLSDDSVPNVTIDQVKNKDKYFMSIVAAHCGSSSDTSIVSNASSIESRTKKIGVTNSGETIYGFKDGSDNILKEAYNTYKIGRDDAINFEAFVAKSPVFLWQDKFGDYITFYNQSYAPLAECGKPVIYLYPTTKTNVSVKVDAKITKSDPEYKNGWDVIANPSGLIENNGRIYDSLFWEGTGQDYFLPKAGFVVKSEDIKDTLYRQLSQLGLNKKESDDFVAFWLPKMPKTNYVRLTWLGKKEMDVLAPLSITPKPDTIIRIFLDFEGLNQPVQIKSQHLAKIERKGFTVVEWGGLLRGNN